MASSPSAWKSGRLRARRRAKSQSAFLPGGISPDRTGQMNLGHNRRHVWRYFVNEFVVGAISVSYTTVANWL